MRLDKSITKETPYRIEDLRPRDSTKPAASYVSLSRAIERAATAAVELKSNAVLLSITDKYLIIANALYSAGVAVPTVEAILVNAASYFTRHLSASTTKPLKGIPNMNSYVEAASAAYLTGTASVCGEALRAARFEKLFPWQEEVLSVLGSVLDGGEIQKRPDMTGAPPQYGPEFADLFVAVSRKDRPGFRERLERYLLKHWGPDAEKAAKYELNLKPSRYAGKWALFTAALCKLMTEVPALSPKAMQYIPVELVRADLNEKEYPQKGKSGPTAPVDAASIDSGHSETKKGRIKKAKSQSRSTHSPSGKR